MMQRPIIVKTRSGHKRFGRETAGRQGGKIEGDARRRIC
jgi:hypothetical protein